MLGNEFMMHGKGYYDAGKDTYDGLGKNLMRPP